MLRIGNVLSDASINVINIHQQTGRVGINKNPTGFMFDVSGSINCDSIFVRDSIFQGGAAQWSKSSTDLYYLDGNVGIGTNDPRSALHVVGTMNANSLGVHIGQQGTNAAIELVAGDSQDAFIDFTKVSADKRGRIRYSNSDDSFRIETNNTEQICIDSGGNVGIGTTSPIYALDVDGVIRNNSSIIMTGNNLYSQSSYFNIESQHTSGYFRFRVNVGGTGGVDVMRISNNGNVGIGTTLPDYTLDVNGNMRITSNLIVEGDLSGSGANLHNIPSSSLDQNSLTINGVEVSLGGAVTLLASQWETSGNELIYNVNSSPAFKVSKDGLALPQYDVEMKGKYTAASVDPTYAWEFRNATGTAIVNDLVNGLAATPAGGATSTSEGMVFGSGDTVNIDTFDIASENFTIEVYFIYNGTNNYSNIFDLGGYNGGSTQLISVRRWGAENRIQTYYNHNTTHSGDTGTLTADFTRHLHIVFSISNSNSQITFYVNQDEVSTNAITSMSDITKTLSSAILGSPNTTYSFEATMAYFRIWDGTSLSASDVAALYSRRDTLTTPQLDFHVNNQLSLAVTENGLALPQYDVEMKGKYTAASVDPTYAWEFRNATGSAIVNDLVSGVAATPAGGATSTSEGMVFDGSSNYVELTPFQMGETFSMEVYVNMINFDESLYNKSVFSTKNDGINEFTERIEITGGGSAAPRNLKFFRGSNSVNSGSEIFSSHTDFVHIVIIVKDSAGATGSTTAKVDIYLNGSYISTGDVNNIPNIIRHDYRLGWKLTHDNSGQVISVNTEANPLEGTIAYFRIWNGTALSASDVAALYSRRDTLTTPQLDFHVNNQLSLAVTENGLALPQYDVEVKGTSWASSVKPTYAWEFRNATAMNTVYDLIHGLSATPIGGANSTTSGMVFDGTDDYIDLGPIQTGGTRTIEIYFDLDILNTDTSDYPNLYSFADGQNNNEISLYYTTANNILTYKHGDSGVLFSSTNLSNYTGLIHHVITVEHSGSTANIKQYINAEEIISHTTSIQFTVHTRAINYIGARCNNTRRSKTNVSYFRIWQGTALSASDVGSLYADRNRVFNGPQLDFHVNDQLSLAITENGVALPQYDVEMKGKYTAASVDPTYAWEFRNATGTATVYDMVSGVAADPSGATSTSEGMVFDGVDDYVNLTPFLFGGTFTIEFMVKAEPSFENDWDKILTAHQASPTKYHYVQFNGSTGKIVLAGTSSGGAATTSTSSSSSFLHVVMTIDNTSSIFYVNGVQEGTGSGYTYDKLVYTNLFLGQDYPTQNHPLTGTIAYFRIWQDTALSASDVARLYTNRNAVGPKLDFHVNNQLSLAISENGLALPQYDVEVKGNELACTKPTYAWEFRNATGTATVYDLVGGKEATPQNGATSSSEGMTFSGTDDIVNAGTISLSSTVYTVESYVKRIDTGYAFIYDIGDRTHGLFIHNDNDYLSFVYGPSATEEDFAYTNQLDANTLLHIVAVVDIASGNVDIYVNKTKVSASISLPTIPSSSPFSIGHRFNRTTSEYFNGTISYLRIWNGTALSASEVEFLYNTRETKYTQNDFKLFNNPRLDFHVNDQLSLAVTNNGLALPQYDVEVKGNELACTKPTYAWEFRNATGTATVYDLVSSFPALPQNGATSDATGMNLNPSEHVSLYNLSFGTSFSIEMYFELTNYTIEFSRLFQYAPQTGNEATSKMWITVDSNIDFGGNGVHNLTNDQAVLTSDPISSSVFIHIVVTRNHSNYSMYIDGTYKSSGTGKESALTSRSASLGSGASYGDFQGTISYFRIWNGTTLSASEVEFLYNTRETKYTQNDFKLFNHHRLDFHVNNQLSLAISENGLALPQYDVEMKGNEVSCTKPTYAWEFRNATGTATVYDLVSSFPALPQNGATSDATGINFDGVDDYVQLTPFEIGGNTFSFEVYVDITNVSSIFRRVFVFGTDGNSNRIGFMGSNPSTRGLFSNINNKNYENTSTYFGSGIVHVVIAVNGTNLVVYKNGIMDYTATMDNITELSTREFYWLGADPVFTTSERYMAGRISFFRVWHNTTLSASEAEFLYNTRETKYTQNDFKLFNHHRLDFHVNDQLSLAISENGLALPQYDVEMKGKYTAASVEPTYAWEFRNGTGTSVVYDMVNGVAAAPLGGAYSTTEGMVYDGVDDYVDLTPWYIGAESFSAEAYVIYKNARQSYARVFGFGDGQNADNIYVSAYGTSGRIRFSIRQANTPKNFTTTNTFFDINEWVHVVATLDGTTMKIYVNGDFIGSYSGHSPIGKTRNYHLLGKSNFSQNNDGWFEGTQAYFRWWQGTALSASDVTRLYAHRNAVGPGLQIHSNNELALGITQNTLSMPRYNLVMEARSPFPGLSVGPTYAWEFRDATGSAVVNDWVSGVAATPTNGATSTSEGMVFDGTNDYVSVGNIERSGTAQTVEIFMKPHTLTYQKTFFSFAGGVYRARIGRASSGSTSSLEVISNNTASWHGGGEAPDTGSLNNVFIANTFVHLVIVFSTSGTTMYKDGVEIASDTHTYVTGTSSTNYLGSYTTSTDYIHMTLAYVRIWDGTSLSASDVATLYSNREYRESFNFNVCGKSALTVGGKVGIGTTSPSSKLHIDCGSTATSDGLLIENDYESNNQVTFLRLGIGANNYAQISAHTEPGDKTYLQFHTQSGTGAFSERMRITSAGNVGIGTTSPQEKLHVVSDSTHLFLEGTSNSNVIIQSCPGPNFRTTGKHEICFGHYVTYANKGHENYIDFKVNDGLQTSPPLRMRINGNGNVGIGTTSPSSSLHVAGAIDSSPDSKGIHMGILDSNHAGIEICASSTSYDSYIDFNVPTVSIKGRINYKHATNSMHFGTNGTQDRVNITSDGRVGIGTVNPSTGLDVNGNFQSQFTRIFGRSSQGYIGHRNFLDDIESMGNTGSTYQYNYAVQVASNGNHRFNASDVLFLCVQNSIKLAINSSGNVGIGTTSPRYPLEVSNYVSNRVYQGNTNVNYYTIVQSSGNALAINRDQNVTSNISALFSHGLAAHELHFFSDERIKKNIVDLSDNEALETLRLIQPKKYEYVDQFTRTNKTVYGYIAQQIQEVLPYAVSEIPNTVPNIYNIADIRSEIVYTEAPDISAVSTVGIHTIYVDISNVNTSAEVSMNVVMVEQSNISQNAVFSKTDLEDGSDNYKLTFNDGYNTTSLHESSNILRLMDASNQEYHITIKNIETSYRVEIEEDLSGVVNAQGEVFVEGQQVPQNVYKLMFSAFDTATLDASSATLKLVDASDVTQYVNIVSVLDSSTLQIDDDLQYMVLDSSNQLFVYGQKVSKDLTSLTFDGSYNVSDISENMVSLKVLDISSQPHDVKVYSKESDANRLLLDEDIRDKIRYGVSGELFVQGQNRNITKHILNIQNYDTANLDASSTNLCIYDISNAKHEVSIVSVFDGSNIEISEDPTSFAHEGQVFVYGQKVDDFHTLSKEYINVVTLSAVQELDRALTKVTQEKNDLQTDLTELKTLLQNKGII